MAVVAYAPASIGNVSVGFDVLGAALAPIDGALLGDRVEVHESEQAFSLTCRGRFAHKLPDDPQKNIVYSCYLGYAEALQKKGLTIKPLHMVLEKNLPIGSGLGSSASSIVAALEGLNGFHDFALDQDEQLLLMGELEGRISGSVHYDNVAPCYLGGIQLMIEEAGIISQSVPDFANWFWVACYPGISISTAEARAILPKEYSRSDCLTYGRRLAAFVHASYTGQEALAAAVLKDVIAEPYRQALIPGFNAVREHAAAKGALATGISGSGPTVFIAMTDKEKALEMKSWLEANFIQNQDGFCHVCHIDRNGTTVSKIA